LDARERRERPDQHGRTHPLGLADGVQQRVHSIRAVHVCAARRAEQRLRARRQPGERVASGLALVIGLRLDDHARRATVFDRAADQLARDLENGTIVEVSRQRSHCPLPSPSFKTSKAAASCSRSRGSEVPPSEIFDSSNDSGASTARSSCSRSASTALWALSSSEVSWDSAPPLASAVRTSPAASGFFFCGMIEEPELHASGSSQKPNSLLDQSTSSAPRRERWVAQVAAAPR